jgi:hypothetical protein
MITSRSALPRCANLHVGLQNRSRLGCPQLRHVLNVRLSNMPVSYVQRKQRELDQIRLQSDGRRGR